ncbi:MAG: phytanoyl-CoA dioxygenase family protein [Gammaproteobacteria bacterium]|nr:phytanoyl-CoA dioxygenase family protein [Gammaproteobacteria bacterium]
MIDNKDIDSYNETGYLVVEGILDATELGRLREAVDRLVEGSRFITENDELYDLEDDHDANRPRVRRLKSPDRHDAVFKALVGNAKVLDVLGRLWGTGIRFDVAKLNMKLGAGGAPVEWHQDWAFYPHTNDDLAAVGFMLDDMTEANGPLLVLPGSHRGPVYSHHVDGVFCGAVDIEAEGIDVSAAHTLTAPAGSISIHHVRALHGSAPNRSGDPRRLLLHQYCASDAWPLVRPLSYDQYCAALVAGEPTIRPRMQDLPVLMPFKPAPSQGSIYENQRSATRRYFA